MLLGLLQITSGKAFFKERDVTTVTRSPELRRQMQVVFQDPYASLNARMTVREIITEGMTIHRIGADAQERSGTRLRN